MPCAHLILRTVVRAWSAPPTRLGLMRVLVGLFAVVYLLVRVRYVVDLVDLPAHQFRPLGVLAGLQRPAPAPLLLTWWALTWVGACLFTLGIAHRVIAPIYALSLLSLLTYCNSWVKVFHTENLLVLHTLVLALVPSDRALTWHHRFRDGGSVPRWRFGWPLWLMGAVTVTSYTAAAAAKLKNSGLAWLDPEWLRYWIAYDNLRKLAHGHWPAHVGIWLVQHPMWLVPVSAFGVGVELVAPLALIKKFPARLWSAAIVLFHWGVLVTMMVGFPYHLLGLHVLPLLEPERWPPLRRWLRRTAHPRERHP